MAPMPKPPKIKKPNVAPPPSVRKKTPSSGGTANPNFMYANQAGKRNALPQSQNKRYSTGDNQWATVMAGGKRMRMGPSTVMTPTRQTPKRLTLQDVMRILGGGGADVEKPSGVTSVRG